MPISANKYYFWALHCRRWVTFTWQLPAALPEGFLLLLSVESLCTVSSYNFLLAGEQQQNSARCHRCMGQGISLCAESVIFRCKKGMLERRRKAVFYYCRVNLTILTLVNCQLVWGMGGWVWGVLFISNI